jgi:hypothetical protein
MICLSFACNSMMCCFAFVMRNVRSAPLALTTLLAFAVGVMAILGQARRCDKLPGFQAAPMVITGQNAPAEIAVRPSIEKAADMEASATPR